EPRSDRERQCKDPPYPDAKAAGNPGVIHAGAELAAEAGARQEKLERDREGTAYQDDESAITADPDAEDLVAPAKRLGKLDELLLRSHRVVDRRNRHEDEADGEEDLVEMALGVDMDVERLLDDDAEDGSHQEDQRQRRQKGHAGA